jgi:hypothetical protein
MKAQEKPARIIKRRDGSFGFDTGIYSHRERANKKVL